MFTGSVSIVALFYLYTWEFDFKNIISKFFPEGRKKRVLFLLVLIMTSPVTIPVGIILILIITLIFFLIIKNSCDKKMDIRPDLKKLFESASIDAGG